MDKGTTQLMEKLISDIKSLGREGAPETHQPWPGINEERLRDIVSTFVAVLQKTQEMDTVYPLSLQKEIAKQLAKASH